MACDARGGHSVVRIAAVAATLGTVMVLPTPVLTQQLVYVTLHEIRFAVTDRRGVPVVGLRPSDFTVYDRDQRQEVAAFTPNVQSPVSLALVLDRSQSLEGRLPAVLESAATFVASVVRDHEDQAAVIAFDAKVYRLQNWTSDTTLVARTVRALTAAGGTSIFDAIVKTCRDQFDPADARQKALVLVTDGEDTTSMASLDDAISMARQARVAVYVLGVRADDSLSTRELQGRRVLSQLADLTGGRVFYSATYGNDSLPALFAKVEEEMRNGYRLSYYLEGPPDGAFHSIRVEPKDKGQTVHAPSGYYGHVSRSPS